jgi:MYXO-CTERM domain-containing protein
MTTPHENGGGSAVKVTTRKWKFGKAWTARAAAAVAVVLVAGGPARAFYWYGWPGSRLTVQQTLITPPHQETPGNPPVVVVTPPPGTGHTPPPPVGPPVPIDQPPVGPTHTPEPSTALLGALGLGALATVRRWRKKQ